MIPPFVVSHNSKNINNTIINKNNNEVNYNYSTFFPTNDVIFMSHRLNDPDDDDMEHDDNDLIMGSDGRSASSRLALLPYDKARKDGITYCGDGNDDDDHNKDNDHNKSINKLDKHNNNHNNISVRSRRVLHNFMVMSFMFSVHHGCVSSCLSLATARLGPDLGARQSSILYLAYTGSALVGATYLVKQWGAHQTLVLGLFLYCFYVAAFGWTAYYKEETSSSSLFLSPPNAAAVAATATTITHTLWVASAYLGALLGGLGAGFMWTAQGSFFAQAATAHAEASWILSQCNDKTLTVADVTFIKEQITGQSTAQMAGIFAFFYLTLELVLRSLSSAMRSHWTTLFNIYSVLTVATTFAMAVWVKPPNLTHQRPDKEGHLSTYSLWHQVTAALQLWWPRIGSSPPTDRFSIMPFMFGLNAVFGLESAFLNAYVNGQVVPAQSVGFWTAWASGVAAVCSLFFGRLTSNPAFSSTDSASTTAGPGRFYDSSHTIWHNCKGWVLSLGAISFASVVVPFIIEPQVSIWTSTPYAKWVFFLVYTLHGVGRATFEGTLKATFADFFPEEKEGAFANIILQNGLTTSLGYFLTSHSTCNGSKGGRYCIEYQDGNAHALGWMEFLIVFVGLMAVAGYWKAAYMIQKEQRRRCRSDMDANSSPPI